MLKQEDKNSFINAMGKEMTEHDNGKHWKIFHKANLNQSIIKSIWYFKRKCDPARTIKNIKASGFTHRRTQQWEESYFETHAPAVSWLSSHFLLALSIVLSLDTRSIDFTMVCIQAKIRKTCACKFPGDMKFKKKRAQELFACNY